MFDVDCASKLFKTKQGVNSRDAHAQTVKVCSHSVATGGCSPRREGSMQTEHLRRSKNLADDMARVKAILDRLSVVMMHELDLEDPFGSYCPLDAAEQHGITYRHTLTSKSATAANLQCIALSWNATGGMICAAFGKSCISGWCDDPGIICCWHLFRDGFSPNVPSCSFDYSCCFTSLACHPSNPSLLAAGTFNGEVLLYDLASPLDALRAVSDVNIYFHREPITALKWALNMKMSNSNKDLHLVSVSGEGRVLWWSPKTFLKSNSETNAHIPVPVSGMSISRNMGLTPGRPPVVGGTTLAVTQSSIIIGSIGGLLLRCSASTWRNEDNTAQSSSTLRFEQDATEILHQLHPQAQKKLIRHLEIWAASGRKKYINARDIFTSKPNFDLIFPSFEAITEFEPHVGPITAIATSPFHRNLFLTVGVDGSFKLRSALQSPALSYSTGVINGVGRDCAPVPLYAADWSKARPLVFAVAGDEGVVQIYDLRAQSTRPVAELKLPGETPRVLSIEFNPKMREFIACGDSSGHVHLWQLSWGLSNPVPLEHEILQAYAESDTLIH